MELSVHVLDCSYGVSAADVGVVLRRQDGSVWRDMAQGRTNSGGQLSVWSDKSIDAGTYRLDFDLDGYYGILGVAPLFPRALVEFRIADPDADLHMSLMVTSRFYLICRGGL